MRRERGQATVHIGRIGLDQVLDYKRRKGLDQHAIERWLAPYLDYEPSGVSEPAPVLT